MLYCLATSEFQFLMSERLPSVTDQIELYKHVLKVYIVGVKKLPIDFQQVHKLYMQVDQVCMMEDKSNADIPADKEEWRAQKAVKPQKTVVRTFCGDGQWPCNRPLIRATSRLALATTAVMMTSIMTSSHKLS